MHVQSCCFAHSTYCFFEVVVVVVVVVSSAPYYLKVRQHKLLST